MWDEGELLLLQFSRNDFYIAQYSARELARAAGRDVGLDVLVEGRPRRGLLDRPQPGQRLVALDRQLGDLLLQPHRGLQHLTGQRDREPGQLLGKITCSIDRGRGESRGDAQWQGERLHMNSVQ